MTQALVWALQMVSAIGTLYRREFKLSNFYVSSSYVP